MTNNEIVNNMLATPKAVIQLVKAIAAVGFNKERAIPAVIEWLKDTPLPNGITTEAVAEILFDAVFANQMEFIDHRTIGLIELQAELLPGFNTRQLSDLNLQIQPYIKKLHAYAYTNNNLDKDFLRPEARKIVEGAKFMDGVSTDAVVEMLVFIANDPRECSLEDKNPEWAKGVEGLNHEEANIYLNTVLNPEHGERRSQEISDILWEHNLDRVEALDDIRKYIEKLDVPQDKSENAAKVLMQWFLRDAHKMDKRLFTPKVKEARKKARTIISEDLSRENIDWLAKECKFAMDAAFLVGFDPKFLRPVLLAHYRADGVPPTLTPEQVADYITLAIGAAAPEDENLNKIFKGN